jgi:peptide/nickel transport system permease protein
MRKFILRYLIPRIIQYLTLIFVGITVTFIIPRLAPTDPVEAQVSMMIARGSSLDPESIEAMRTALTDLYGLSGSPVEQYSRLGVACSGATLALRSVISRPPCPR